MPSTPLTIPETYLLNIYSEKGTIFSGQVYALSTKNEVGPLSIISGHANFISLITADVLYYETPVFTQGQKVSLELGVLRVYNNAAEIYVGVGLSGLSAQNNPKLAKHSKN